MNSTPKSRNKDSIIPKRQTIKLPSYILQCGPKEISRFPSEFFMIQIKLPKGGL
jgi:hypothetical protein